MEWKYWNGKRIFVKLNSGGVYSGNVTDVDDTLGETFIEIIDKFGKKVAFPVSEIIKIVEEEER